MFEIKLKYIIAQLIDKEVSDYDPSISKRYYLKHMNFYGEENKHLAIPKDEDSIHPPTYRRDGEYLTGNEFVYGDILLHHSGGHDGTETIQTVSSLEESKEQILDLGGMLNSFTSDMNVFVNGKLKPYHIYLEDNKGNQLVFVKGSHDNLFYDLVEAGMHIEFAWID